TANLAGIGGPSSAQLFDDGPGGAHGDAVAGDGIFSLAVTIPGDAAPGLLSLPVHAADSQGRSADASVDLDVPPPNNSCASAEVVPAEGGSFARSSAGAISDGLAVCAPDSAGVWYSWTPCSSGVAVLDTCGSALLPGGIDTVLAIFAGCSPS